MLRTSANGRAASGRRLRGARGRGGAGRGSRGARKAAAGTGDIAVAFAGWLNVHIPLGGREAQRHLVKPLKADVFIAGTYLPGDCPPIQEQTPHRGECLVERLYGLRPLTSVEMKPMLTRAKLEVLARAAPAFDEVARGFKVHETYDGVMMFAPVLGNPNVSVLRELHDTERCLRLITRHEASRGWRYSRLIFSRL